MQSVTMQAVREIFETMRREDSQVTCGGCLWRTVCRRIERLEDGDNGTCVAAVPGRDEQ